jgi:hypothetical protein
MQIETELYQMLIENLQYSIDSGEQQWLSGCNLNYCQECRNCGFNNYKIRPIVNNDKVIGLYLDYDGINGETITTQAVKRQLRSPC